jgi:uncharacterized protein (DUF2141 family)
MVGRFQTAVILMPWVLALVVVMLVDSIARAQTPPAMSAATVAVNEAPATATAQTQSGAAELAANPVKGRLVVRMTNFRSDEGQVGVVLWNSDVGFPEKIKKAFRKKRGTVKDGVCEVVFDNVPFGEYAVSVLHDENNNSQMDTNFLGIPDEGLGTSNDVRNMGPPRYEQASFRFAAAGQEVPVSMWYFKFY